MEADKEYRHQWQHRSMDLVLTDNANSPRLMLEYQKNPSGI
jgi:hypothetical protein